MAPPFAAGSFKVVLLVALAASLACGCGGDPAGSLPPDPPQVRIAVEASAIADTVLRASLNVSGCESVQAMELYDGERKLGDVAYQGNPTTVQIEPNEISYANGLSALVGLSARVQCSDGRVNQSQPVSVRFLPVAQTAPGVNGGQAAPDVFYVEGAGEETRLVGCTGLENGATGLAEVDTTGNVTRLQSAVSLPCNTAVQFTDRNALSGKRWMWEPGIGAAAIGPELEPSGAILSLKPSVLAVGPDGDAILFEAPYPGAGLARISHSNGGVVWRRDTYGSLLGQPVVQNSARIILPIYKNFIGQGFGVIGIEVIDYRNGITMSTHDLFILPYTGVERPIVPPATLSPDGSLLFVPVETAPGQSHVVACATTSTSGNCTGPTLKWQSPTFGTRVSMITPFANNSRLAVVGAQKTYFLDAATGEVLNPMAPIVTTGALTTRFVQAGKGTDLYLLNGSAQGGLPSEIVAVDAAERGEVYRFEAAAGSLMVGVDGSGQSWVRVNKKLVRPLPLMQYRQVLE